MKNFYKKQIVLFAGILMITFGVSGKCIDRYNTLNEKAYESYTSPSVKKWTAFDSYFDIIPNIFGYNSIPTINLSTSENILEIDPSSYTSKISASENQFIAARLSPINCTNVDVTYLGIEVDEASVAGGTLKLGLYENNTLVYETSPLTITGGVDELIGETVSSAITMSSNSAYQIGLIYSGPDYLYVKIATSPVHLGIAYFESGYSYFNTSTTYPTLPDPYEATGAWAFNTAFKIDGIPTSKHTSATIDTTACAIYTSPSGNYTWTVSGTYMDTIPNAVGCDSVLTINLSMNTSPGCIPVTILGIDPSSFTSKISASDNQFIAARLSPINCTEVDATYIGVEVDGASAAGGTLKLGLYENNTLIYETRALSITGGVDELVGEAMSSIISMSSASKYQIGLIYSGPDFLYVKIATSPVHLGIAYFESGYSYFNTATTYPTLPDPYEASGAWAFNTAFKIEGIPTSKNTSATIDVTECATYTSPSNNYTWTVSGIYSDTIPNSVGCDSIITINLTINAETSFTVSGNTITANVANADYQWLDCDNNYSIIDNETNQSFTAISDGSYAFEITENSCIDTSSCVLIIVTGLDDFTFGKDFKLYPSPADKSVTLYLGTLRRSPASVSIINTIGENVYVVEKVEKNEIILPLNNLSSGLYFISIQIDGQKKVLKLIKK